mmetsp:Transcript_130474/g.194238  ORF Transcript_130474/g.194238 Transcript_130474/m.194238 type:complete len:228 (+) Transcript_130474:3253-3936(+)
MIWPPRPRHRRRLISSSKSSTRRQSARRLPSGSRKLPNKLSRLARPVPRASARSRLRLKSAVTSGWHARTLVWTVTAMRLFTLTSRSSRAIVPCLGRRRPRRRPLRTKRRRSSNPLRTRWRSPPPPGTLTSRPCKATTSCSTPTATSCSSLAMTSRCRAALPTSTRPLAPPVSPPLRSSSLDTRATLLRSPILALPSTASLARSQWAVLSFRVAPSSWRGIRTTCLW